MSDGSRTTPPVSVHVLCRDCKRGPEACEWCCGLVYEDFEGVCDCGVAEFGRHLLGDCRARSQFRFVVVATEEGDKAARR